MLNKIKLKELFGMGQLISAWYREKVLTMALI